MKKLLLTLVAAAALTFGAAGNANATWWFYYAPNHNGPLFYANYPDGSEQVLYYPSLSACAAAYSSYVNGRNLY